MPTPSSSFDPLPTVGDALLAMLGAWPDDDALVLGQSGPTFTATQSATLTAWRLQQAYRHLLAVAPLWAALLESPNRASEIDSAFATHPWRLLIKQLLPAWCQSLRNESESEMHSAQATANLPELGVALRCWQRLHDQFWQALDLPPLIPVTAASFTAFRSLPQAPLPLHWQQQLQAMAERVGRLSAQALQTQVVAQPGNRHSVCLQEGVTLHRYDATTTGAATRARSLLMVYAWVNDCQVLDLAPDQSLIAALQAQGITVWLLDWGAAGAQGFTIESYLAQLDQAVNHVRTAEAIPAVSLLGICQGGTLALLYAGLHHERVASLSLAATPVDFHCHSDRLSAWVRSPLFTAQLSSLARVSAHSPALLNLLFLQLKPFSLRLGKYLALLLEPPSATQFAAFLRLENWLMVGPLLSGPGLADYAQQCYRDNRLQRQQMQVGARTITLSTLPMPLQLLIADSDHIVPPAASLALTGLGINRIAVAHFATGHIGLLVGRARLAVAETVAVFLQQKDEGAG